MAAQLLMQRRVELDTGAVVAAKAQVDTLGALDVSEAACTLVLVDEFAVRFSIDIPRYQMRTGHFYHRSPSAYRTFLS
jgi:hypothetical protein